MKNDQKIRFVLLLLCCIFTSWQARATIYGASLPDTTLPINGNQMFHTNCDMVFCPTIGNEQLRTVVWDEYDGSNFYVYLHVFDGVSTPVTIPLQQDSYNPDVAILDDPGFTGYDYTIAVTYEVAGNIYIDYYDVTAVGIALDVSLNTTTQLSFTTDGTASNPHIDAACDIKNMISNYPALDTFAVCWQEFNGTNNEIHGVFGSAQAVGTVWPIAGLPIAGENPDIAGLQDIGVIGVLNYQTHALISFFDPVGLRVRVFDFMLAAGTSSNSLFTNPNTTLFAGYPRIEAHGVANYLDVDTAYWMLVVARKALISNPYEMYYYDQVNGAPFSVSAGLANAFSNEYGAIAAGCGELGNGQLGLIGGMYTTMLQPTNDVSVYASRVTNAGGAAVTDYYEINLGALATGYTPIIAISSSTNSDYGLFAVWYDGTNLYYKTSDNVNYAFRPTHTGTLQKLNVPFRLFPNPAQSFISIRGIEAANYSITDALGRQQISGTVAKAERININDLAAGNYFINLRENGKQQTLRFVKL